MTRSGEKLEGYADGAERPGIPSILLAALPVICFLIEPNLTSVLLPFAVGVGAIAMFRKRSVTVDPLRRAAPLFVFPLTFLVWAGIALTWTPPEGGDLSRILKLAGVLICVAMLLLVPLGRWPRSVLLGIALGFAILSPILIEASLNGWFRDTLTQGREVWIWYNWEKKPAALLAVFLFPIALGLRRIAPRAVLFGAVALFSVAVLASGYAAAILALVVGAALAAMGWLLPRAAAVAPVLVLGFLAFVIPVSLPQAPLSPILTAVPSSSAQHRVLIADFVSQRIAEKPLLGWGLDASRAIPEGSTRIVDTPSRADRVDPDLLAYGVQDVAQNLPLHPHNVILQVRLELGAIGAALWIAGVAMLLWRVSRIRDPLARASAFGQIAAVLTIWSVSFGAWQSWWLAAIALSVVAARCAGSVNAREDEERAPT